MVRNIRVIGMCALLALSAGAAVAQDQSEFKKPLARTHDAAPSQPSSGGNSWTVIRSSDDDGDSYEVTINNGEIAAKVNGKAVPADRIRRSDNKVEILDKKGNTVKTFDVTVNSSGAGEAHAGRALNRAYGPAQPKPPTPPGQQRSIVIDGVHPKVMIGITMSQPSDALAEHLGIKTDEAVVVERVYEGMAAERAGLKGQDIITDVDGVHPVTQQNFRETINKKEPGDKVTLKVLRKGEEKKVTIELQKFDGEKLGVGQMQGMEMPGAQAWPQWDAQGMPGNQQWQDAMKEALKSGKGNAFVWGQDGPGEQFRFMAPGMDAKRLDEMQGQIDKKIAELDEKLAKINEQMERLEKLLNKMSEKQSR